MIVEQPRPKRKWKLPADLEEFLAPSDDESEAFDSDEDFITRDSATSDGSESESESAASTEPEEEDLETEVATLSLGKIEPHKPTANQKRKKMEGTRTLRKRQKVDYTVHKPYETLLDDLGDDDETENSQPSKKRKIGDLRVVEEHRTRQPQCYGENLRADISDDDEVKIEKHVPTFQTLQSSKTARRDSVSLLDLTEAMCAMAKPPAMGNPWEQLQKEHTALRQMYALGVTVNPIEKESKQLHKSAYQCMKLLKKRVAVNLNKIAGRDKNAETRRLIRLCSSKEDHRENLALIRKLSRMEASQKAAILRPS